MFCLVVPFVLCFVVEFCTFSYFHLSGRLLGIAAHSAYDMFSKYKQQIVN